MPRYYFHIRNGEDLARDPEGAEFETLDLARAEAIKSARELLSQRVLRGDLVNGDSFELTGDDGVVADIVKFRDAMRMA